MSINGRFSSGGAASNPLVTALEVPDPKVVSSGQDKAQPAGSADTRLPSPGSRITHVELLQKRLKVHERSRINSATQRIYFLDGEPHLKRNLLTNSFEEWVLAGSNRGQGSFTAFQAPEASAGQSFKVDPGTRATDRPLSSQADSPVRPPSTGFGDIDVDYVKLIVNWAAAEHEPEKTSHQASANETTMQTNPPTFTDAVQAAHLPLAPTPQPPAGKLPPGDQSALTSGAQASPNDRNPDAVRTIPSASVPPPVDRPSNTGASSSGSNPGRVPEVGLTKKWRIEKQKGLHCGQHALNSLLNRSFFNNDVLNRLTSKANDRTASDTLENYSYGYYQAEVLVNALNDALLKLGRQNGLSDHYELKYVSGNGPAMDEAMLKSLITELMPSSSAPPRMQSFILATGTHYIACRWIDGAWRNLDSLKQPSKGRKFNDLNDRIIESVGDFVRKRSPRALIVPGESPGPGRYAPSAPADVATVVQIGADSRYPADTPPSPMPAQQSTSAEPTSDARGKNALGRLRKIFSKPAGKEHSADVGSSPRQGPFNKSGNFVQRILKAQQPASPIERQTASAGRPPIPPRSSSLNWSRKGVGAIASPTEQVSHAPPPIPEGREGTGMEKPLPKIPEPEILTPVRPQEPEQEIVALFGEINGLRIPVNPRHKDMYQRLGVRILSKAESDAPIPKPVPGPISTPKPRGQISRDEWMRELIIPKHIQLKVDDPQEIAKREEADKAFMAEVARRGIPEWRREPTMCPFPPRPEEGHADREQYDHWFYEEINSWAKECRHLPRFAADYVGPGRKAKKVKTLESEARRIRKALEMNAEEFTFDPQGKLGIPGSPLPLPRAIGYLPRLKVLRLPREYEKQKKTNQWNESVFQLALFRPEIRIEYFDTGLSRFLRPFQKLTRKDEPTTGRNS